MGYKVLNNAFSTLAGAINAVATSITVATGHGDRFPVIAGADYTYITFEDSSGNIEIVKVTARATASDVMTIARGQDGTVARSWAAGDIVELRIVATLLDFAIAHVDDTTDAHTASAIKNVSAGSISSTTVQDALNELDGDIITLSNNIGTVSSYLTAHLNDSVDAHDASAISYSGGTGISATDVEGAIDELANEKANVAGQTFTGPVSVPDDAYAASWNASVEVPTKNAVYDKIHSMGQIFAVDSSVASNAMTLTIKAQTIHFRHQTLTNGSVNKYTLTSDVSLTIPNGATLGGVDGVEQTYLLLSIDNGGTIEAAVVNQSGALNLDESGLINTTVLNASSDSNSVIYSTTARSNVPYRVVGKFKHTQSSSGVYASDATLKQGIGGEVKANPSVKSYVRVNTANGYGSTNTRIRRFSTVVANQGSDITYTDSATLGGAFTVNTDGVYSISYSDGFSVSSAAGISLNTTEPTTDIRSIAIADILASTVNNNSTASCITCSWTGYLPAGSVVRAHANASGTSTPNTSVFTIVRVA